MSIPFVSLPLPRFRSMEPPHFLPRRLLPYAAPSFPPSPDPPARPHATDQPPPASDSPEREAPPPSDHGVAAGLLAGTRMHGSICGAPSSWLDRGASVELVILPHGFGRIPDRSSARNPRENMPPRCSDGISSVGIVGGWRVDGAAARKPGFELPTAGSTDLPVLLFLMAQVPFYINVDNRHREELVLVILLASEKASNIFT